jgi:alkyldihydroxyacetonephosphate synthase
MHRQDGLSAQSGNQLHAAPPCAASSQYQPDKQTFVPHEKQVPSAQGSAWLAEASSSLASSSVGSARPVSTGWEVSACSAVRGSGAASPPHAPASPAPRRKAVKRPGRGPKLRRERGSAGSPCASVTKQTYTRTDAAGTSLRAVLPRRRRLNLEDVELEAAIRQALPGMPVSATAPDRDAYARDLWPRRLVELQVERASPRRPSAIVWPENAEQISALIDLARRLEFALVPFGAGSGVCGAIEPDRSAVVVDVKRFAGYRILPGPVLDVGAGALGITLEEELVGQGYTIGHYPSSILCSTVGGWVAARGAGQCSGRYGKVEDMITSLDVVLGTGELVRAQRRQSGPDLVPLLAGSEGTLGIITRVGLRLHVAPTERRFAAFAFPNMNAGIHAVRALFQNGLRPAVVRLYDPLDTFLLADDEHEHGPRSKRKGKLGIRAELLRTVLHAPRVLAKALALAEATVLAKAALVLVHEGTSVASAQEAEQAGVLCREAGGASLGEGPARAWYRRRYSVSYRQSPVFRAGAFSDTMEVAAPWVKIPGVYEAVRRALGEHVLVMAHMSHAYPDGASLYFTFAGTAHGGDDALEVYDRAWRVALGAALAAGATLSHHHGVGRSKAPRLGDELGSGLAVVRSLKQAWDPHGLLNPGALLPPVSAAERAQLDAPGNEPELDTISGIAALPGTFSVARAESYLGSRGHSLGLSDGALARQGSRSVDAWIGAGMPGLPDRFDDPVFAPLAGFTAVIGGRRVALRPAPRRAVGPDLTALLLGTSGEFGSVERAHLVALPAAAPRPAPLPFTAERDPAPTDEERAAFARLARALEADAGASAKFGA